MSWAVICLTYLRFRSAVRKQSLNRAIPKEAISPLQPYLAVYGLFWGLLLSGPLETRSDISGFRWLSFFQA